MAGLAARARGDRAESAGPTVSTRRHYRVGFLNLVYRAPDVGEFEYSSESVPGLDGGRTPEEIAVFVHGWLIDDADAETTFGIVRETLRANGYDAPLVGYEWDADQVYWFDDWYPSVEIARRNGGKLARFLADLRRRNPDTAVRLIGHSLGTRVVLAALGSLAVDDHPTGDWDGVVEHVTLLGAALDDEAPTPLGEYGDAVRDRAGAVDNFHTPADERLARGYRSVEFEAPLGTVGADGPTPTNYEDHNAGPVQDHLDYYRQGVGVLDTAIAEWRSGGEVPGEPDTPGLPDPGDPDDPLPPDPGPPADPDEPEVPWAPGDGDGTGDDPDEGGRDDGTGDDRRITGRLSAGATATYSHRVGSGVDRLVVTLSATGNADLDLYVTTDGREPTAVDYDRASWSIGGDERIELSDPAGSVGIAVDAFAGGGRYTLTVAEE